ncbi:MAG: PQQ-binding-like beta-propeller repeat protein [Clostridia bacterium]|nr:PQQ-binding-like beta-propeller repeat protein [Clostridia bacterium]
MSEFKHREFPQDTQNAPAVDARHRRSGSQAGTNTTRIADAEPPFRSTAPFSRVSGVVRAASDENPTRENQPLTSRARVAYGGDGEYHRPVQAPGYREVEPLRTAKRAAVQVPASRQTRPAEQPAPTRRRGRGLLIAVIVLLVLALAFLGLILWKGWPPFGGTKDAAATTAPVMVTTPTIPLNASATEGMVPFTVTFTVTTGQSAERILLVDSNSDPLQELKEYAESGNSRNWSLSYEFKQPYDGIVQAFAYNANDTLVGQTEPLTLAMRSPDATPTPVPETIASVQETEDTAGVTEVALLNDDSDPEDSDLISEEVRSLEPDETEPEDELEAETLETEAAVIAAVSAETPPIVTQAPVELGTPTPAAVVVAEVTVETPTPEPTEEPTPTPTPEPVEEKIPARRMAPVAAEGADPGLIKNVKVYEGKKKITDYLRASADTVDMPDAENYLVREMGVFTFRGSSFRQNAASGTVSNPTSMRVIWRQEASSVKDDNKKMYYGIGVGSQPVIIQWSITVREMSNLTEEKKNKSALREVIIAGEDGKIYFFDLEDGEPTRKAINLGYPMRATPSLSVKGYPFMLLGQYARKIPNTKRQIGMRGYNLLNSKEITFFNGLDTDYKNTKRPYSTVGNFDTSALYDKNSDSVIFAGGNGMLYVAKQKNILNASKAEYSTEVSYMVMATQATKEATAKTAVQSDLAAYQGYAFYADMGGYLRCVDVNTMTVQWAVATGDAVESAVALDLDEDENLWLYTANTLQNRTKGDASIRRYNAETGEEMWTLAVNVTIPKNKGYTPGFIASPVIGQNSLADYVYYTVSGLSATGGDTVFGQKEAVSGALICVEKATGRIRWAYKLSSYSYSSPVAVYDAEGNGWIVQAASDGTISLLDGRSGSLIQSMQVEGTINGSPAVYNSTLVIGTQGKGTSYIYGIALE